MPVKRWQFNRDPDLYQYAVSRDLLVYDVDTADVLDQLLKHMDALFMMNAGGGTMLQSALLAAYGMHGYRSVREQRAMEKRLVRDCHLLTTAVAQMIALSGPDDDDARHGVFTAIRAKVPWLHLLPHATLWRDSEPATTA